MKKLSEVVAESGMTRRVIQEYEDNGILVKPVETNKYGYLLYDDIDTEEVWKVRYLRDLGFDKKNIKRIQNSSIQQRQVFLKNQVKCLEEKICDLEKTIRIEQLLNDLGVPFERIQDIAQTKSYDMLRNMLAASGEVLDSMDDFSGEFKEVLTESEVESCCEDFIKITEFFKSGVSFSNVEVQNVVHKMHKVISKEISELTFAFTWYILSFAPGTIIGEDIDNTYGTGCSEYFYQACREYCDNIDNNETDLLFYSALNEIIDLSWKGYKAGSKEVQELVGKVFIVFSKIAICDYQCHLDILSVIGKIFASEYFKDLLDDGQPRGVSWFISTSIAIYVALARCESGVKLTKGDIESIKSVMLC